MAGGGSSRQKMINLMYLVFIAMIAMNVDKEILSAFEIFNNKFESSNERLKEDNRLALNGLEAKATEQPEKYKPLLAKANRVKEISNEFYTYLGSVRKEVLKGVDTSSYANLDKTAVLDEMWFTGDGYTKKGQEFLDHIEQYKADMTDALGEEFSGVAAQVREKFNTEPVKRQKDNQTVKWLKYNFEGFPLAASVTRFTQMQNDVKATEQEVYSSLLQGQLQSDVSLSNYEAIVIPDKTAFYSGEPFTGKVVLGRFDESMTFDKVVVNGKEVSNFEKGAAMLDFPAGAVGDRELKGQIIYTENGEEKSIPIKSQYSVINRPNSATISADKMNVVYRGVSNPMTIGFAGISADKIKANAPGLRQVSGSNYMMNPGSGREVKISVTGTLPDGKPVTDSKTFRIKDIPSPVGSIRGEMGVVKMQRQGLEISTVGAQLPDFDFDLDLQVTGFKFKVPGQATIAVSGNKLDSRAKSVLQSASRGETVQIFDIEARIQGNSSYKLKQVSAVLIELTN